MRERDLRWGILGTGAAARDFTLGLRTVPGARALTVASRTLARAERFAKALRVEGATEGLEALVANPDVDVVYVATPHERHAEDARSCLLAGKPVLCEKPFALDAREAGQVLETARAERRFCMEAMWMRFIPLMRRVRELVRAGEIGDVRMLTASFALPTARFESSRYFDPARGGGAMLERGVYAVSLAHWLLGAPSDVVGRASMGDSGVDEQNAAILTHANGALSVLTTGLTTQASNEAEILGTRGSIRLHGFFFRPERITLTRFAEPLPPGDALDSLRTGPLAALQRSRWARTARIRAGQLLSPGGRGGRDTIEAVSGNGYGYEAAEVARCLREGVLESPHMTWRETIEVMETLDALRDHWGIRRPAHGSG